jgi:uncharacterized MnhB-related membrane protein
MKLFSILMLIFLIVSSIAVSTMKSKLGSIIVFAVYSLIMAILWEQLEAPDLAITEAAVGAGITTVLLMMTLTKIKGMKK